MEVKNRKLERDESKYIWCEYEGRKDQCPNVCTQCTFAMKADGDAATAEGNTDLAIRQYKRALFAEPRFADAWVSLGNVYGMRAEYNNALAAFDRAIKIDPIYGDALFGKAIVLRSIGQTGAAMLLINTILKLYDHDRARKLKDKMLVDGVIDPDAEHTREQAIDSLMERAYDILIENDILCGSNGELHTDAELCKREKFAHRIIQFCKKLYGSLGKEKVHSESILTAFYASLCATLFYYQDKDGFANTDPFDYLVDHIDLEQTETTAERLLGMLQDEEACAELWDMIYDYVRAALEILANLRSAEEVEQTVQNATENACMIGVMYAMRAHERKS